MSDGDLLDELTARLWRVRERLGARVYRAAARAALGAVGAAVLAEAERRAGVRRPAGAVLRFPLGRRRGK
ncbi:MAG TPA: hypothetical protein VIF34_11355 [Methylocystis sp.]|jgi:hypothetical protein